MHRSASALRSNVARRVSRALRSEDGSAVVELAIISTLLLIMLLGTVTFGLTHHQNISIEGAAREAARFGATYPVDDAGSLEQWLENVALVGEGAATGAMSATDDSRVVCVALGGGSDPTGFSRIRVTGTTAIEAGTAEADWCFENTAPTLDTVVQVQLQRSGWIEAVVFSMKPNLKGEATNRFERVEQ